jgi:hypothetical protein
MTIAARDKAGPDTIVLIHDAKARSAMTYADVPLRSPDPELRA